MPSHPSFSSTWMGAGWKRAFRGTGPSATPGLIQPTRRPRAEQRALRRSEIGR
eukprot:jgi/Botrbrau1/1073/Bobra.0076s0038.1